MDTVVITGADGFIGSHLSAYLADKKIPIIALIQKNSKTRSRISSLRNVTILEWNRGDQAAITSQIPSGSISAFYHLAWSGVSPESRGSVEEQSVNITLSLEALTLAKQIGARRFITLGSTMEYMYAGKPIDKTAIPTPQNAYGAVKLAVRYLCQEAAKEIGIPFIYAVATGVYGPGRVDNNVITYTIKKLLDKERPSLSKLEQRWDYVHIDDLAEALYLIGEKWKDGAFYGIGHGDDQPLSQYIDILHALIDPTVALGIGDIPYSQKELPSSCVDLHPLKEDTGFVPKIPFEVGVRGVIDALKAERNGR